MCPNEVIHRLLDILSKSIDHISDQTVLQKINSDLEHIKSALESGIDKCG